MAHRVADAYTQECRGLHGHSYLIEICINDQSCADMVMDFKLLKEKMKPLLDSMDHAIMISNEDEFLRKIGPLLNPKCLVVPFNPTAENMAKWIYSEVYNILYSDSCTLKYVAVHETDTAYACYFDYDYNFDKINDRLYGEDSVVSGYPDCYSEDIIRSFQ